MQIPCKRMKRASASAVQEPRANSAPALVPFRRKRASAVEEPTANRRKRTAGASSVEEPRSNSSPWASLHQDMIRLVACRVLAGENGIADYLCFRAVCSSWRSSTVCPRGRGVVDPRFHPRHWMLLPEGYRLYPGHTKLRGCVRFVNLRTGAIARIRLPIFKDHFALDSVDGLLLLHRDHDMAARLLHPFTGDIVDLPPLIVLVPPPEPLQPASRFLFRDVSATAVSVNPDGVITVMLASHRDGVSRIAFATSEDQQWTLSSWETKYRVTTLSLQGKLYFVAPGNEVFEVEPPRKNDKGSSSLQSPMLIATCPPGTIYHPLHLVECNSEILLVGHADALMSHFVIYRLADISMGRFIPQKCTGDSSLFLSRDRSICVSSKAHPTIAGDSIVDTDLEFSCLKNYHLKSGTRSTATDGHIFHGPIPSPYTIIHHIYTCCVRRFWNKGQIFCKERNDRPSWGAKKKWRFGG